MLQCFVTTSEEDKAERGAMRKAAAARKKAKSMMPREEDISHLVDHLLSSAL